MTERTIILTVILVALFVIVFLGLFTFLNYLRGKKIDYLLRHAPRLDVTINPATVSFTTHPGGESAKNMDTNPGTQTDTPPVPFDPNTVDVSEAILKICELKGITAHADIQNFLSTSLSHPLFLAISLMNEFPGGYTIIRAPRLYPQPNRVDFVYDYQVQGSALNGGSFEGAGDSLLLACALTWLDWKLSLKSHGSDDSEQKEA